jgi:hypothetical protein
MGTSSNRDNAYRNPAGSHCPDTSAIRGSNPERNSRTPSREGQKAHRPTDPRSAHQDRGWNTLPSNPRIRTNPFTVTHTDAPTTRVPGNAIRTTTPSSNTNPTQLEILSPRTPDDDEGEAVETLGSGPSPGSRLA